MLIYRYVLHLSEALEERGSTRIWVFFLGRHRFTVIKRLQPSPLLHICKVWCSSTFTLMSDAMVVAVQTHASSQDYVHSSMPQLVVLKTSGLILPCEPPSPSYICVKTLGFQQALPSMWAFV